MLSTIGTATTNTTAATTAAATIDQASNNPKDTSAPVVSTGSISISTLGRQIADAEQAEKIRDSSLDRASLGKEAATIVDQIVGNTYYANKAQNDAEVPNTTDPALLARAKQATAFLHDSAIRGHSVANPFASLTSDQLTAIAYDTSGNFTVNERQAAWQESYNREEAWREKVVAQGNDEYNSTGKMTDFFQAVLDHYNQLPAIEQAQYPADYASSLADKVKLDFNFMTGVAGNSAKKSDPVDMIQAALNRSRVADHPTPVNADNAQNSKNVGTSSSQ